VGHGIDFVLLVGTEVAHLAEALPAGRCLGHVATPDEAAEPLFGELRADDVVMVKGSRRIALESLVAALMAQGERQPLVGNG
jgi:UDP-N-acetylmuramoyl-tripeptide--D-alanyl-D-alanine ligase